MDKERRRYLREIITQSITAPDVFVEGEPVDLINFSTGGLQIHSRKPLDLKKVGITINSGDNGKLKLTGHVVRVEKEGSKWSIAIDLSKQYMIRKP